MDFSRLAYDVGRNLRGLKRSFDRKIGKTERPYVFPYRGYGNPARILVMGRALRDPGLAEAQTTDNWLKNLVNSYKRIQTDELPGARVRVSFGGLAQDLIADDEGFFRATLPLSTPPPPDAGYWHDARIDLIDPAGEAPHTTVAKTLVPPADAEFGIISDLDDTVVQTGAANIMRMARATLLGNARTRLPFAGVAAFYAALQRGGTGTGFNPVFYVSSSPWNLYDVIEQFLALHTIPMGPLLLRDWGVSLERIPFGHAGHKLAAIRHIVDMYPTLRFILIGDSGQQDPEIYREVAREYPHRVAAAYIRDVTPGAARAASLEKIGAEMAQVGSRMVVAPDTIAAARDAAAAGWIVKDALAEIVDEKERSAPAG